MKPEDMLAHLGRNVPEGDTVVGLITITDDGGVRMLYTSVVEEDYMLRILDAAKKAVGKSVTVQ